MTENRRMKKVNAMLREAIAKVILKDVKHPKISNCWITITRVSLSRDLQSARVYVSIMPHENSQEETLAALKASADSLLVKLLKMSFSNIIQICTSM